MSKPAAELHLSSFGLHNIGIVWGAIGIVALVLAATVGQGLAVPSLRVLLGLVAILILGTGVLFEVRARTAYLAVSAGRLRWRLVLREGLRSHSKPLGSIRRVEALPNGDVAITFQDRHSPLRLSAKEFRAADLNMLVRLISSDLGRDLGKH